MLSHRAAGGGTHAENRGRFYSLFSDISFTYFGMISSGDLPVSNAPEHSAEELPNWQCHMEETCVSSRLHAACEFDTRHSPV